MVEFVTLFLGLVSGPQAVEVSVSRDVAVIEALVDGRRIAATDRWPWILECDFGEELSPHELIVVASTSEGVEIGKARQWVNLPRERLEARLVVDHAPRRTYASLLLTDVDDREPASVRVFFDGRELSPVSADRFQLPSHDIRSPHFLRAEVEMSASEHAYAELVFGGSFGESVDRELSALVVEVAGRLPSPATMSGWFEKGGVALEVAAVERGAADIIIVRERSSSTIEALSAFVEAAVRQRARTRRPLIVTPVLGDRDRVRFVLPTEHRAASAIGETRALNQVEQIPVSDNVAAFGGLSEILTDLAVPGFDTALASQQLADAVAIAGLTATRGHRRRAVLLITAGDSVDTSRFAPQQVEAYLEKLAVPFVVWNVGEPSSEGVARWHRVRLVADHVEMRTALSDLRRMLESQAVVWLIGAHLSHEIDLAPTLSSLRRISVGRTSR